MTRDDYRIRDVPASCTCLWIYVSSPARWICQRVDPRCIWHKRAAA